MAKKYPILRSTNSNLRAQITAALNYLSASIGGPDNPDELVPPYDALTMRWRNIWAAGQYYAGDVVIDLPYTMIANKDTSDRAAPQPIGSPEYDLPDVPAWVEQANNSIIDSGHQYTFSETVELRGIRVWGPEVTANTSYNAVLVKTSPGQPPVYVTRDDLVLTAGQWTTLAIGSEIIRAGDQWLLTLTAQNSGTEQTWAYNWEMQSSSNNTDPNAGFWNTNVQQSILRINWEDAEAIPGFHQLELQVVPDTIFEIAQLGSLEKLVHYKVIGLYTEGADWTEYNVTLVRQENGGPDVGSGTQIRAVQPISDPTKYAEQAAWWTANQPLWGTIQGALYFDGVNQGPPIDTAFGVDLQIQRLSISEDWDFVSKSSG